VFDAIGNSLSRLYVNSVSYFNAYYNAKRIFDEAEATLISQELAARGKTGTASTAIPQALRDRFNAVIDKCSSILSFHPTSVLVDDAIFLIGKSYYYLNDYVRAERKFTELLAQFPNGEHALEAKLWFARTLDKLNRDDDAIRVAEQLAIDALDDGEQGLAGEAYALLGSLYEQEGDTARALQNYAQAGTTATDRFVAANAFAKQGDLLVTLGAYEEAVQAYVRVPQLTSDIYLNYYSRFQASRALAEHGRHEAALGLLDEVLGEFRYNQFHPTVRLEYARILAAAGRFVEAEQEYRYLDTTYVRQEVGAKSAYALAQLMESRGDYRTAHKFYARAASSPIGEIALPSRKRDAALTRYFFLQSEFAKLDSLAALSDSLRNLPPPEEVAAAEPADTAGVEEEMAVEEAGRDSIATEKLGVTVEADAVQQQPTFVPLDPDSVRARRGRLAYDLGEVFYTEFEIPDSAFYWFRRYFEFSPDSLRAPRALFILAELSRVHQEKDYADDRDLYQKLIQEYPNSTYAEEARRILGIATIRQADDVAERVYAEAESLISSGRYREAIRQLQSLAEDQHGSPLAARSQLAIGWIYEHRLHNPDSALHYYRRVVREYDKTPYAAAIRDRITPKPEGETADSVRVQQQKKDNGQQPPTVRDIDDEAIRPGARPAAIPDTIRSRRVIRD
jgi:TolA-binding protein